MSRVTYVKGPLGRTVLLDGKVVGRINDVRNHGCWQVRVPGLNAADAVRDGKAFQGTTTFPTLALAKAAVERVLTASPVP